MLADEADKLYSKTKPSIAVITSSCGICAAVKVADDLLLTAQHCVAALREVYVSWDDEQASKQGQIIAINVKDDLALIRIESDFKRPAIPILTNDKTVNVGTEVFAIGHPLAADLYSWEGFKFDFVFVLTRGMVSKVNKGRFFADVSVSGGNSGGPILDKSGTIIGIVSKKFAGPFAGQMSINTSHQKINEFLLSTQTQKTKEPVSIFFARSNISVNYKLAHDTRFSKPDGKGYSFDLDLFDRFHFSYGRYSFKNVGQQSASRKDLRLGYIMELPLTRTIPLRLGLLFLDSKVSKFGDFRKTDRAIGCQLGIFSDLLRLEYFNFLNKEHDNSTILSINLLPLISNLF